MWIASFVRGNVTNHEFGCKFDQNLIKKKKNKKVQMTFRDFKTLIKGVSIPAELVQAWGEAMINVMA